MYFGKFVWCAIKWVGWQKYFSYYIGIAVKTCRVGSLAYKFLWTGREKRERKLKKYLGLFYPNPFYLNEFYFSHP
jgi:hypothetical protein